jgi:archaellum component FlaC
MLRRILISVPFWCCGGLVPAARALELLPLWLQRGAAAEEEEAPSPESKRWRHLESRDLEDVKKRVDVVERDVKEANEKIGNVREDVAVVHTLVEGLTKEVERVRAEADKNKDELKNEIAAVRGEAKENKDELKSEAKENKNELKSEIQKAVAEIKEQIDFVTNCGAAFAVFSWVTFVGGKINWGKFFDFLKKRLRIS